MNQITHDFMTASPRAERKSVDLHCEIRVSGGKWRPGRVSNLTCDGFQFYTRESPSDGTAIMLRFAGLAPIGAVVCWNARAKTGCKFERPLSVYVFEHIVREHGTLTG